MATRVLFKTSIRILHALMCMGAWSWAQANSDAFIKLLEVLRDNGTINQTAYDTLREAALAEQNRAQQQASDSSTTPAGQAATRPVQDAGKNEAKDPAPKLRIGGRLHVDLASYKEDRTQLGSGSEVRRVRLSTRGALWNDWDFRASVEFASNEVDLKSTYIRYNGFERKQIRFGNFKEPFSLDELSSSNYNTFMERAMATEFAPGRNIGLGFNTYGDTWAISTGVFRGDATSEGEEDEGHGLSGRITFAPVLGNRRLLHLGGAVSYRDPGEDDTVRFRARPESHVTDVRLVDTEDVGEVENVTRVGTEAALIVGPWSLQGEYIAAEVARDGGFSDLDFSGWYVQGSWFLTGESRRYDPVRGVFRRIKPNSIVGKGGYGAWEFGARFSSIDLNDGDVIGGRQDNLTLGLNWYATPHIRFMLNYIDVLSVDRPGSSTDGDEPEIIQLRGQINL